VKRRTILVASKGTLETVLRGEGVAAARELIRTGAVYLRGRRVTEPTHSVQPGDVMTVVLEESGQLMGAVPSAVVSLAVLHDGPDFLVVNKPAGVVAQPTPGRLGDSLLDAASRHLGRTAGLVHRLDKETSGVTLFGKTPEATSAAAQAFRGGTARKVYLAVCGSQVPDAGHIDLPISKDPSRPGRQRASRRANGARAQTAYRVLSRLDECAVVALYPQTGRTHQLRAHLTALGAPIVGDTLYGGAPGPRCLLHALRLTLLAQTFAAPPPTDLMEVLRAAAVDWTSVG
jgi:23S rRNA pseudouridine1911/1915/1917 synthase